MSYLFPSEEWVSEIQKQINTSDAYASAARTWEGDFVFVVQEGPGIYLDLWHGKCRSAEFVENPSQRNAEFKITASRNQWQRIIEGQLDPIQGMVTRQIKLDGNLVKIMKSVKAAQELVRCATLVDTRFD